MLDKKNYKQQIKEARVEDCPLKKTDYCPSISCVGYNINCPNYIKDEK